MKETKRNILKGKGFAMLLSGIICLIISIEESWRTKDSFFVLGITGSIILICVGVLDIRKSTKGDGE